MRATAITNEANQRKAAALCQHICLLSESVAKRERQREAAAFHQRPEALALVKDCRAVMQAELFAVSSLADERSHPEIASSNLFDAARARIQATCKLLAAPLDAILADIERDDIEEGARTTPLVDAPSLPSMVDGIIQKVHPCTRPCRCHCTGQRNIPRAPSSSVEVPPLTHPHQMLDGLHTPASTTLA